MQMLQIMKHGSKRVTTQPDSIVKMKGFFCRHTIQIIEVGVHSYNHEWRKHVTVFRKLTICTVVQTFSFCYFSRVPECHWYVLSFFFMCQFSDTGSHIKM